MVSPLAPKAAWPEVKAFAKGIAEAMAADSSRRFVATIAKTKRRGKILVDYLRNQRGMTAVAAYSPRARAGATFSAPLGRDELDQIGGSDAHTLINAREWLAPPDRHPRDGFRRAAAAINAGRQDLGR